MVWYVLHLKTIIFKIKKLFRNHLTELIVAGSTSYLLKLGGSLLCGWISDPLGRKKSMILINIPVLLSWYFFYNSTTILRVFIANGLLSLASGFMKSLCVTYVGEIR